MYLVTAGEMQEMDRRTIADYGIPGRVLMESAGRGAVRFLRTNFPERLTDRVGVAAGRGNNGGDGFVIARYLASHGARVTVYLLARKERVSGDAEANLSLLEPLGVPVLEITDAAAFTNLEAQMGRESLWVDAMLGTGLQSDVRGLYRRAIDHINNLGKPVFSVDIPSGVDADSGRICGTAIRAQATATFGHAKIGHFCHPGAACAGRLEIVDIGIPPFISDDIAPRQFLITPEAVRWGWQPRPSNAHKGTSGHLLAVAGSPGKTGAAAMCALSAMRAGAGLVTLGVPAALNPVLEPQVTEVMTLALAETTTGMLSDAALDTLRSHLEGKQCLALGPGLGTAAETRRLVHALLRESRVPVVVDADGLNVLADDPTVLKHAPAPVVLTPHPGEMSRLTGRPVAEIQADRVASARQAALDYDCHVVLKGAGTVVAHPDGRVFVNQAGNPGMASGGMGDVLTGVIAGLVTQGYPVAYAARAGVYLHAAAAERLMRNRGPIGFLATEVMDALPEEIAALTTGG